MQEFISVNANLTFSVLKFAILQKILYLCSRFAPTRPKIGRKGWRTINMNEFLEKEEQVLQMLRTVYDPEIPVNVYDLGLIYRIDISDEGVCTIEMTLTAPSCPAADFLMEDIRQKVASVDGISEVKVNLVFEPEWTKEMMSEEAKLELGFL